MTPELRESVIEFVDIDQLIQHPRNVNQGDVGAICESIQRNGTYGCVSVQVSTKHICRGNHTVLALQSLGYTQARVEWLDITDEEALAIMVADNRIPELAHRDDQDVANLLSELAQSEAGLQGTGYDNDDLDQLLADIAADEKRGQDTEPSELPKDPITKSGDLWILGEHRLLCGDATKAEDYDRLLEGQKVDLLLTDPPYGVAIGDKNAALESVGKGTTKAGSLSGDMGMEQVEKLWRSAFPVMHSAIPEGCSWYVFGPQGGDLGLLLLLLREAKLEPRHILIWVKHRASFSLGRLDYEYMHEPIVYGWKPGAAHSWYAKEQQTSILEFDRPTSSNEHPTMKPIPLLEQLIANSAKPGGMVIDPFGGSGSALIAAENLGRTARLMEIEPNYADVICKRFQAHTGIKPEREGVRHDFLQE